MLYEASPKKRSFMNLAYTMVEDPDIFIQPEEILYKAEQEIETFQNVEKDWHKLVGSKELLDTLDLIGSFFDLLSYYAINKEEEVPKLLPAFKVAVNYQYYLSQ